MNLTAQYADVKRALAAGQFSEISNQGILALIDLTLLDEQASHDAILALQKTGTAMGVAALCILPKHLSILISPIGVKLATVVNFPSGNEPQSHILTTMEHLITEHKIDEIDYVFPYETYLIGDHQTALESYRECLEFARNRGIIFKVILETGALPSLTTIYRLSRSIIDQGCDFIKTSTGKIVPGATPEAAFAMLKAIKDSGSPCGFKASGGVRHRSQALEYIHLASLILERPVDKTCFRIGASSLIDDLK